MQNLFKQISSSFEFVLSAGEKEKEKEKQIFFKEYIFLI